MDYNVLLSLSSSRIALITKTSTTTTMPVTIPARYSIPILLLRFIHKGDLIGITTVKPASRLRCASRQEQECHNNQFTHFDLSLLGPIPDYDLRQYTRSRGSICAAPARICFCGNVDILRRGNCLPNTDTTPRWLLFSRQALPVPERRLITQSAKLKQLRRIFTATGPEKPLSVKI